MAKKFHFRRLSQSWKNKFIDINGVTYYGDSKNSSGSEESVYDEIYSSGRRIDLNYFRGLVLKSTLESPFNKRPIKSKDIIQFSKKEYSDEINCFISKKSSGFLFSEEYSDVNEIILSVLTKYKKNNPNSTWNYFSKKREKSLDIFISAPKRKDELNDLINLFTEISEVIRVIVGVQCKINIVLPNSSGSTKQKEYSLSLGIGVFLSSIVLNKVSQELVKALTKGNTYSRDTEKRLLGWAKKQKDLNVINLGDSSFYVSRKVLEKDKKTTEAIMKEGISEKPRNITDYLKKSLEEDKDLVVYSDSNSSCILAHELGHYIVSKKRFLKRLQNGVFFRTISKHDWFIAFVAIILGVSGNVVPGILAAILMKSPELISEFAASYYGMKLLKETGCSKKELEKAKSDFRKAYFTYINNTLGISLNGITGGILGDHYNLGSMPDII